MARKRREGEEEIPIEDLVEDLNKIISNGIDLILKIEKLKAIEEGRKVDAKRVQALQKYKKEIDKVIKKMYE